MDPARLAAVLRTHCRDRDVPVLLVEDDAATRAMVRRMLEREGLPIAEAVNGSDGLDQVAQRRPSLVLLDLLMPGLDGFGFLAELQARPEWRSIPVVVVTAKDLSAEDRARLSGRVAEVLPQGVPDPGAAPGRGTEADGRCAGRSGPGVSAQSRRYD